MFKSASLVTFWFRDYVKSYDSTTECFEWMYIQYALDLQIL